MIWFYRDFLDGPIYYVVVVLSIIFIMAIIGFIIERKQLEQEKKNREAVLADVSISSSNVGEANISNVNTSTIPENPEVSTIPSSPLPPNTIPTVDTVPPTAESNVTGANTSVSPTPAVNAATNENIPSVLDFDAIDKQNS